MFCPYCLKHNSRIVAEEGCKLTLDDEIMNIKTSDERIIPNLNAIRKDGRLINNFNRSKNIQWKFYTCPRCKCRFKTKEQIAYYSYNYKPKQEDIDRYDGQIALNKIDNIVERHIESDYPNTIKMLQQLFSPRGRATIDKNGMVNDTTRVDEDEIHTLIIRLFGNDIKKDIEEDLNEQYRNGKITLDDVYQMMELIDREIKYIESIDM